MWKYQPHSPTAAAARGGGLRATVTPQSESQCPTPISVRARQPRATRHIAARGTRVARGTARPIAPHGGEPSARSPSLDAARIAGPPPATRDRRRAALTSIYTQMRGGVGTCASKVQRLACLIDEAVLDHALGDGHDLLLLNLARRLLSPGTRRDSRSQPQRAPARRFRTAGSRARLSDGMR